MKSAGNCNVVVLERAHSFEFQMYTVGTLERLLCCKRSCHINCCYIVYRAQQYAKTKAVDSTPLPSLVVCPPTLTGHWVDEVGKFCTKEYLNPLHYTGPPTERAR